MTRKELFLLLYPSAFLLVIAIAAFMFFTASLRYHDVDRELESRRTYERFVESVKSGKWQLTPEAMLKGMRLERDVAKAEYEISRTSGKFIGTLGLIGVIGFFVHVISVFSFRTKLNKTQSCSDFPDSSGKLPTP